MHSSGHNKAACVNHSTVLHICKASLRSVSVGALGAARGECGKDLPLGTWVYQEEEKANDGESRDAHRGVPTRSRLRVAGPEAFLTIFSSNGCSGRP
jgi:hypothetical protein